MLRPETGVRCWQRILQRWRGINNGRTTQRMVVWHVIASGSGYILDQRQTSNLPATRNRIDTRGKRCEQKSEVTAQQARLVDAGWFMGSCSRVSGKLAGSSESHPASPQRAGGGGPKATRDRLIHSAGSARRTLHDGRSSRSTGGAASRACTPLGKRHSAFLLRSLLCPGPVHAARQRPVRGGTRFGALGVRVTNVDAATESRSLLTP